MTIKDDFIDMGVLISDLNINVKDIYYDNVHLNKYGHSIYSEIISKHINKENYLK